MHSLHDLEILIESGKPLVVVETEREGCFVDGFERMSKRSQKVFFHWTMTQGLRRLGGEYETQSMYGDPSKLLGYIFASDTPSVFILVDMHHHLPEPLVIRSIKDIRQQCPHHCIILLSQQIKLPAELKSHAVHYRLPLPTRKQLNEMVSELAAKWRAKHGEKVRLENKALVKRLVAALCGLNDVDAKRFAEDAIFDDGIINMDDIHNISKEKFSLLDKEGVLNLELEHVRLKDLAGFERLKQWLDVRRAVFLGDAKLPSDDKPKGMLLLGVQGCGKSLAAKAVAGSWHVPLLHLDFAQIYDRWHGQTEKNFTSALRVAEKMQPCVLWIDEIEKGLSAVSGNDDVSKRILGTFLTWLEEKSQSVFVVATANNIAALPAELIRKGRFDEIFFVDLPNLDSRIEILKLHLERRGISLDEEEIIILAEHMVGFSGAEIEQVIVAAIYQTYANKLPIRFELLMDLAGSTYPLSITMQESISELRAWGRNRAVPVD